MADNRRHNGSSRVQRSEVTEHAPPRRRRDRKVLMVQLMGAFLVLAMLLPVVAFFFA